MQWHAAAHAHTHTQASCCSSVAVQDLVWASHGGWAVLHNARAPGALVDGVPLLRNGLRAACRVGDVLWMRYVCAARAAAAHCPGCGSCTPGCQPELWSAVLLRCDALLDMSDMARLSANGASVTPHAAASLCRRAHRDAGPKCVVCAQRGGVGPLHLPGGCAHRQPLEVLGAPGQRHCAPGGPMRQRSGACLGRCRWQGHPRLCDRRRRTWWWWAQMVCCMHCTKHTRHPTALSLVESCNPEP